MSKPRVTARHETQSIVTRALCSPHDQATPSILVEVAFDLHDHLAALADLEFAVHRVREQIEETRSDV